VIATGFREDVIQPKITRPSFGQVKPNIGVVKREPKREEPQQEPQPQRSSSSSQEDALDIPTFLRNRNRRR
jgi:cell division protein FtsZ